MRGARGLKLIEIETITVATYIEQLGTHVSKPTAKPALAAIQQLFDYLTTAGVLENDSAASVRWPKYVVRRGKNSRAVIRGGVQAARSN